VKRFAKIILAILAGLVALLVLVLVGINLYLQSGNVQQRIRLATEQALGMPVTVKRTLYTPWSGLTLSGLSLPDPTIPGVTLVDAPKFSVQFEFWPLLNRKFIITSVSLSEPHLSLRQTEDDKWVIVPPKPARPTAEKPSGEAPAAVPGSGPVSVAPIRPPAFTVELQQFHVNGGSADIIDRRGITLAHVEGLVIDGEIDAGHRVEGNLWIDRIAIADTLFPNRLRAHFVQEGDLLSVTDVKCAIADGKVRAEFHAVSPRRKGKPDFTLKTEVEDVSIPTLISEAHGNEVGTSGTLLGHFELRGNPLEADSLVGHGEFSLDAAQLRPVDFIQTIGTILRIDELQMLNLKLAQLRLDVKDERVQINDLTLQTENVIISAKGPIRFDGKMKLDGRLMLNEKLQHQLGGLIGDNFTPSEDANYKQVTFDVTGHIDRPKTNLVEKITGIKLGNMSGLLKGLFRMPTPAPASDATPSPAPESN
jgi:hypothetical protein